MAAFFRKLAADTVAMLLTKAIGFFGGLIIEIVFVWVGEWGVALFRVPYSALTTALGRVCGQMMDSVKERFIGSSQSKIKRVLVSTLVFNAYQSLMYWASIPIVLYLSDIELVVLAKVSLFHLVNGLVTGCFYDTVLSWTRRQLGTAQA